MSQNEKPRPLDRTTFQRIALISLLAPAAAMWWAAPRVYRALGGELFGILGVVITLLVVIVLWALALFPLRARAGMRSLSEEVALARSMDVKDEFARARAAQSAQAVSKDPKDRRRYHVRMAAISALLAVVLGVAAVGNILWEPKTVVMAVPLGAVVAAVLAIYHLGRVVIRS